MATNRLSQKVKEELKKEIHDYLISLVEGTNKMTSVDFIRGLCTKYDMQYANVNYYYYRIYKDLNVKELLYKDDDSTDTPLDNELDNQVDEREVVYSTENKSLKDKSSEDTNSKPFDKPPFYYGQLLDLKVVKVLTNVGAVCKTLDGKYQGLVHVSRIKDAYIADIHEYFEEGDLIKASFHKINNRNEMELSTIGIDNSKRKNINKIDLAPLDIAPSDTGKLKETKDFLDVIGFIKEFADIELRSDEAIDLLASSVQQHGLVRTMRSIVEAQKVFNPDISMLFVKEIEKQSKECL